MLSNHKISIIADTIVSDVRIASHSASLNVKTAELTMGTRHIDKDACKTHRDTVRADQKEFEDFAYSLQDMVKR